jgi:hypothetical protein
MDHGRQSVQIAIQASFGNPPGHKHCCFWDTQEVPKKIKQADYNIHFKEKNTSILLSSVCTENVKHSDEKHKEKELTRHLKA